MGNKIHIPLKESEALRLMLQVKPTAEMPRPGASKMGIKAQVEQELGLSAPNKKRAKKAK